MTRKLVVVVVGHGMVGHRVVQALRDRDSAGQWQVAVLAEEPRPAYDRVALSSYVDSWDAATLVLQGNEFAGDDLVRLHLGDPATGLDLDGRTVTTASGHVEHFDALVLATGSRPFVPPVPGHDLPGCFTYRTIEDLDAIRVAAGHALARGNGRGLVVGGGLLGLEAANVLRSLELDTHVVELAPRLMPLQVDEGGGALLRRLIEHLGPSVHCGVSTQRIERAQDGLRVVLSDQTELGVGLVVFSAGVRPRDELARAAGLGVGECAAVEGRAYGLVGPGYAMAEVVADQLLRGTATFPGADTSTKLKLLGVDVASFGDAHAASPGALEVVHNDPVTGHYRKLVVSDDATTLLGGVLVGDASSYATLRPLVGRPLPADPGSLVAPGVEQSKALCEHFEHSRAELFEIIQATGLRTFSEIVTKYGRGRGCDICKPTVASILASLGSGHVLDGEQASLQDTNDHFLANLQRNATYSVVPRIPGGEITPDKLMVIAEVARDFGLYTKITGGQRIDLFGATVDQLPLIEAMDGGLDHLRDVIVNDSLGICADLEQAMAAHVESYADEWRGVLEDPEKLSRFTSFINVPGTPDPTISFREERGQRVPVTLGIPEVAAR